MAFECILKEPLLSITNANEFTKNRVYKQRKELKIWPAKSLHSNLLRILIKETLGEAQDIRMIPEEDVTLSELRKIMANGETDISGFDHTRWEYLIGSTTNVTWSEINPWEVYRRTHGEYYTMASWNIAREAPYISTLLDRVSYSDELLLNSGYVDFFAKEKEAWDAACEFLNSDEIRNTVGMTWLPKVVMKTTTTRWPFTRGSGGVLAFLAVVSAILVCIYSRKPEPREEQKEEEDLNDTRTNRNIREAIHIRLQAGDVPAMLMICLGCVMAGVMTISVERSSNEMCQLGSLSLHAAILLVLGALVMKTFKLVQIFKATFEKLVEVNQTQIRMAYGVAVIPFVFNMFWVVISSFVWPMQAEWSVWRGNMKFYVDCGNVQASNYVPSFVELILLVYLIVLLWWWRLDRLEDHFRDFQHIFTLFFFAAAILLTKLVVSGIDMNPYTSDYIMLFLLLVWFYCVLFVMVLKKFYDAYMKGKPKLRFLRQTTVDIMKEMRRVVEYEYQSEMIIAGLDGQL